jgi:hypothetical protein
MAVAGIAKASHPAGQSERSTKSLPRQRGTERIRFEVFNTAHRPGRDATGIVHGPIPVRSLT